MQLYNEKDVLLLLEHKLHHHGHQKLQQVNLKISKIKKQLFIQQCIVAQIKFEPFLDFINILNF